MATSLSPNQPLAQQRIPPTCPPKCCISCWHSETYPFLGCVTLSYDASSTTIEQKTLPSQHPLKRHKQARHLPVPCNVQLSLRSLASDLAQLLRDVLTHEYNSSQISPNHPPPPEDFPARTVPTQSLDLGNPSHVAALISTQATPPVTNISSPLDTSSLPKKLEDQISSGEFVDFTLLFPEFRPPHFRSNSPASRRRSGILDTYSEFF